MIYPRLDPVLYAEARHALELFFVVSDQPHTEAERMSGNEQVHRAYRAAGLFEQSPDPAVGFGCLPVIGLPPQRIH